MSVTHADGRLTSRQKDSTCRMTAVWKDGGPHSAAAAASWSAPRELPSCRRAPERLASSKCRPYGVSSPNASVYDAHAASRSPCRACIRHTTRLVTSRLLREARLLQQPARPASWQRHLQQVLLPLWTPAHCRRGGVLWRATRLETHQRRRQYATPPKTLPRSPCGSAQRLEATLPRWGRCRSWPGTPSLGQSHCPGGGPGQTEGSALHAQNSVLMHQGATHAICLLSSCRTMIASVLHDCLTCLEPCFLQVLLVQIDTSTGRCAAWH